MRTILKIHKTIQLFRTGTKFYRQGSVFNSTIKRFSCNQLTGANHQFGKKKYAIPNSEEFQAWKEFFPRLS